MHTSQQEIRQHTNTSKATKAIAAGQEVLVRYGSAIWFESKNIPYVDVDYGSTMWRPDLRPLPCRQSIRKSTVEDGRHIFSVVANLPQGTVLDISLCVKVSVVVVDQFPVLWDYVLMDAPAQTVRALDDADICCKADSP